MSYRKTLEDSTATIAAKRAEKRSWRNRPAPYEVTLRARLDDLEKVCVPVNPIVGLDALSWDRSARGFDIPGHDRIELIYDPRAFYLADPANKKRVVEHIERTLREQYAGIKDTATDAERRSAIAKLDAEILELERLQVAAIRAIRAAGEWVPFPLKVDIRAVLSVDGPKPRPRD